MKPLECYLLKLFFDDKLLFAKILFYLDRNMIHFPHDV